MDALPVALVVVWNAHTLRAQCSYCLKTHGHGFSGSCRHALGRRRSDCHDTGGEYRLVFVDSPSEPFAGHGWEFDRKHREFVVVDARGRVYERSIDVPEVPYRTLMPQHRQSSVEDVANDLGKLGISDSESDSRKDDSKSDTPEDKSTWEDFKDSERYRKIRYIGACVGREVDELQKMFRMWPNDNFAAYVDDETGANGLVLAAAEENAVATLRLLRQHGADINHADRYGRTPLMEAALWGLLDNVCYLTSQGARTDVQDGNDMTAADLASESKRNADERKERSGSIYREPSRADESRQRIAQHLQRISESFAGIPTVDNSTRLRTSFFQRTDRGIAIYRPILELHDPNSKLHNPYSNPPKAFAELDRGAAYPLMYAMSGYNHEGLPNVLNNRIWSLRANTLRRYLGLEPTRSYASHVEPQLLAYLLFHHSLLSIEDDEDDKDWALGQKEDELANVRPEYTHHPVITVSKTGLCCMCEKFVDRMRAKFPWINAEFRFVGDDISSPVTTKAWKD